MNDDISTELHYIGELLMIIGKILILFWFLAWIVVLFSTNPNDIDTHGINLMGVCGILIQPIGFTMSSVFRVRKNAKYSSDLQTNLNHVDYVSKYHYEPTNTPSAPSKGDFIDKTCPDCNGTGRCRWCKGTGKWGWTGLVHTTEIKCNQCYGEGVCRTCGGTGIRKL